MVHRAFLKILILGVWLYSFMVVKARERISGERSLVLPLRNMVGFFWG